MNKIKQKVVQFFCPEYESQMNSLKEMRKLIETLELQNGALRMQIEELKASQADSIAPEKALLENAPWRKLMERLCDQVKRIRKRVTDIRTNEEVAGRSPVPFLESLDSALREAMIASGAEPIDNEMEYDILRHEVVPPIASVPEKAPIADTLEFGVKSGRHVFVRALVELKK